MTLRTPGETEEAVAAVVKPHGSQLYRVRRFLTSLGCNLVGGLRVALFRRVEARSFDATVAQLVALIIIDLFLVFCSDVAAVGLDGHLNLDGLPRALFYLPWLVLASFAIARREANLTLVSLLPLAVLAAGQYITIAGILFAAAAQSDWFDVSGHAGELIYNWGPYVWWMLSSMFAVVCLTRSRWTARPIYAATIALALSVPVLLTPRAATDPLWVANVHDDAAAQPQAPYDAVTTEDAFYAQPDILHSSLAALAAGRPGVEDIYFVGVAGYAADDVFRKELAVVSEVFDQRFGTAGRSINLINNPGTALQAPVASTTSLQRTLDHVGQLMNRDEDMLVLYLTSHGSEDHRLALEFWPLRLRDLDAQTLRKMLDDAGIRWRVLVVSACYSGGFIEPLKDERTLIVTAADASHASFGCGAESDFTYFGKAYVDEALRSSYSLTRAFETARRTIEARERAEGRTPSNPQMYVGKQMADKLEHLERRWASGTQ